MDEGRKRVIAIIAGIFVASHLKTASDLFGRPQGSPHTDGMVAAITHKVRSNEFNFEADGMSGTFLTGD